MIDPVVFQPEGGVGLPFLVLIAITFVLCCYGFIRLLKKSGILKWILATVILLIIGLGFVAIQSSRKVEPITVYSNRVSAPSWTITFDKVKRVEEDQVASTQYVGGRPVVSVQRRLLVVTDDGTKIIAYEAVYDIDSMKSAIEKALAEYKK